MARTKGATSDKPWKDAIRLAVNREAKIPNDPNGKKARRLGIIADKLCALAMEGDVAAIKEIGDRLEGKPAQTHAGDPDNPMVMTNRIERVIVPAGKNTPDIDG